VSTRLTVAAAASLFGVALAGVGVIAGIGSFTSADAPGQVLQVSGVGPVSANPSATAKPNATAKPSATATTDATPRPLATVTTQSGVGQVAPPAAQPLPSYHPARPGPMTPAQPSVPQPGPHSPEPVRSSPGM
jgi:hypothetical protein